MVNTKFLHDRIRLITLLYQINNYFAVSLKIYTKSTLLMKTKFDFVQILILNKQIIIKYV